jgi:hypothetical protein
MRRKRHSLSKRVARRCCLAASIALTALALGATSRDTLLAKYWENELATATGEGAANAIAQLVTLHRPGLAAVVRALGLPDDRRQSAYLQLNEELDRYATCSAAEAAVKLEVFADTLAANIDTLPSAARQRAAKLAMRILLWPQDTPKFDCGQLIAACDRVLKASAVRNLPRIGPKPTVEKTARRLKEVQPATPPPPHTVLPADRSMYLELAELAAPELPRADVAGGALHAQPRLLLPTDAGALVAAGGRAAPASKPRSDVAVAAYTRDAESDQPEEDPAKAARLKMRSLEAIELFAQLNESGEVAAAATAELDARGFSPRQMEVGRHLSSADAAERLRWAEALPGIRGIDARFWLLRLSHDSNLQVRRAAIGLLSTDRDPEVIRRLQQVLAEETDPQLSEQVARALEVLEGP